jgi:hypothetical protein
MLKLKQGQLWKAGDQFLRIVELHRLEVKYKSMQDPAAGEGEHHHVSKKEFCRLLKNATLLTSGAPDDSSGATVISTPSARPGFP